MKKLFVLILFPKLFGMNQLSPDLESANASLQITVHDREAAGVNSPLNSSVAITSEMISFDDDETEPAFQAPTQFRPRKISLAIAKQIAESNSHFIYEEIDEEAGMAILKTRQTRGFTDLLTNLPEILETLATLAQLVSGNNKELDEESTERKNFQVKADKYITRAHSRILGIAGLLTSTAATAIGAYFANSGCGCEK